MMLPGHKALGGSVPVAAGVLGCVNFSQSAQNRAKLCRRAPLGARGRVSQLRRPARAQRERPRTPRANFRASQGPSLATVRTPPSES